MLQQDCLAPSHAGSRGGLLERAPFALQRHVHRLRVPLSQAQAPGTAAFAPAVGGDAAQDARQPFGQGLGAHSLDLEEPGRRPAGAAADASPFPRSGAASRRCAMSAVSSAFRLLETPARASFHAGVDEGGKRGVVAGDAEPLQVVEGAAHAFGAQT